MPNEQFSRKQIDGLIDFSKSHEEGAKGVVWVKYNEDRTFKSSVDKFFNSKDLSMWAKILGCKPGDLMLVISGQKRGLQTTIFIENRSCKSFKFEK